MWKRFWDWAQRFEVLWSLLQLIREQWRILLPAESVVTWLSAQLGIPWPEILLIAVNVAFWIIAWPLLGREAAKRQEHPPALDHEKSDESPVEQGELQKLELDLKTAKAEARIAKTERDQFKQQDEKYKREAGRRKLKGYGQRREPIGLSIAVRFVDPDVEFAERISELFSLREEDEDAAFAVSDEENLPRPEGQ